MPDCPFCYTCRYIVAHIFGHTAPHIVIRTFPPSLPPASVVEVIGTVPSVCVCVSVSLSVSALTAEPFEVWSRYLVQGLTMMTSWTSSMVKVLGQSHQVKKMSFPGFPYLSELISNPGL